MSSDRTVVSLADFRQHVDASAVDQHDALAQIETYWEGLRDGRILPARAEVDPRGIAGALEHAFILERVARGVGRFRLAGMHLNDMLGMEVRGMPLTALILPESRDEMNAALSVVFDEPAMVRLSLTSETGLGRPPMQAQMVLLPLRSDLGDVSRVLGGFVADGKIGRAPRRFSIAAQTRRTLIGFADSAPAPRSEATAERVAQPAPGRHRETVRRGHLTLVSSEDG